MILKMRDWITSYLKKKKIDVFMSEKHIDFIDFFAFTLLAVIFVFAVGYFRCFETVSMSISRIGTEIFKQISIFPNVYIGRRHCIS